MTEYENGAPYADEDWDLPPEALAYVGDTLSRDVRGARAARWRMVIQIYSPTAFKRDRGLAETGLKADRNITDLMQIPGIIKDANREG